MPHNRFHKHASLFSIAHLLPVLVRLGLMLAFLVVATILIPAQIARADGPVVNTTADDESDGCGVGNCTLREALGDPSADEGITFSPSVVGAITLDPVKGQLTITQTLILIGPGADILAINANYQSRVFSITVGSSSAVTISGVTIQNGRVISDGHSGGGVYLHNDSTLTLSNCTIKNNETTGDGGHGGGLFAANGSTATLNDCTIANNEASGSESYGGGAAAHNDAIMTLNNCTVTGNQSSGAGGWGGGIGINVADLNIQNGTAISNNQAAGDGGGIAASYTDTLPIPDVDIVNSTISGNTSGGDGGAVACKGCNLTIDNSTISTNTATNGGGIYQGYEGRIPSSNLTSVTIYDNAATANGGGLGQTTGTLNVENSIVAGNTAGGSGPNCDGTITSQGYNLESGDSCSFSASGDITNTNPLLGPLQDNGGPTWTHAPQANSPATDAGSCSGATTDQRGKPRPIDLPGFTVAPYNSCDIGAFEIQRGEIVAFPPNSHTAPPTGTVSITYDEPVSLTTVTSHTFAVHAMQTGLVTATHGLGDGGLGIVVTPTRAFHAGELVQTTATTATLNITGTEPLSSTVWQFRAATQRGSGDFGAHPTRPTFGPDYSRDMALGDMDGDGDLDAVIAKNGAQQEVWLNDGGDFGAAAFDTVGDTDNNSYSVALGDLDGDGDLDAIIANNGAAQEVYENDGSGNLSPDPDGDTFGGGGSYDIALGDLDGDGDLDAVIANSPTVDGVWLNSGNGSFGGLVHDMFDAGDSRGVALGDVDGDGDLDAVIAKSGPAAQEVWLNDGSGDFTASNTFGGGNSEDIALGDVDGDGDLDAVVANNGAAQTVYLNNGSGDFGATAHDTFGDSNTQSIALGDVDGDGDLDVVTANYGAAQYVRLNDGSGKFDATAHDTFGASNTQSIALGDVDGDGDLDAVIANYGQAQQVWLNHNEIDLAIAKSVDPPIAASGGAITYTITFTNHSSWAATAITIDDTIPPSVTVASRSVVSSGAVISQTAPGYTWYVPRLTPGQVGVITITGVLSNSDHSLTFTNTVEIGGIWTDTAPGDNIARAPITIDTDPPPIPVLISPTHRSTISDTTPTLTWNAVDGAAGYMLDLNGDIIDVGNRTYSTTGELVSGDYTWTVASYDDLDNTSNYTDTWSFTLDADPPDPPVLDSPSDTATINDDTPTLSWKEVTGTGAEGYMLDFNGDIIDVGNTTYSITGVLTDATYTWTVASYDGLHNTGDYTDTWSFTVDTIPPDIPVLSSPEDEDVISDTTPILSWNGVTSATGYMLDFDGDIIDVGNTTFSTTGVLADDTYTWTVASYDDPHNTKGYTDTWSFTVDITPPDIPVLSSPKNNAVISDTTPTFSWNKVDGAAGYMLDFNGGIIDVGDTTSSTVGVQVSGDYTWTVASYDGLHNTSDYADDWSFTLDAIPPGIPILSSPGNNDVISDTTPTLSWVAVDGAAGYMLDFNGDIIDVGKPTFSSVGVLVSGDYTWTVASYDSLHNVGDYAAAWSFTLDATPPGIPVLSSPEDNAVISDTTPTLSWVAVDGAAGYMLDFNGDIIDVGKPTFSSVGVLADGVYVWTVASYDDLHNVSDYAAAWSFTVDNTSPRIKIVDPLDGASNVPRNAFIVVDFDEAMDTGSVSYLITPTITLTPTWYIGNARLTLTHDEFAASAHYTVTVTGGSDPAGNLLSDTPYTWVFTTGIVSMPVVDLALGKARAGEGDVTAGDPITYTFTITNLGPTPSITATIVDEFNDATALAGVSGEGCDWSPGAQIVTCTVTGITTGSPSFLTLVVTTNEAINGNLAFSGTMTNLANVTPVGEVIDTQLSNNTAGPVTITVRADPWPVADAGPDQATRINTVVVLDGSDSYDPGNHYPLTYGWKQIGGDPSVLLTSHTISRTAFNAPGTPTVLTFTLVVTNTLGVVSEPDTLVVTITGWHIYLPVTIKNSPTPP